MTAPRAGLESSLLDVVLTLRRRWGLVIGLPFVLAGITAIVSLLMRPTYTATTSFVPEALGAKLPANLAGLAGQFGLSVGGDASRSPRFYADVLKSRELLERTLLSRFRDPRAGVADSARLLDLLPARGKSAADSLYKGVQLLRNLTATQVTTQTGIVRLSVSSRHAELAADVANRMIAYLNEFNTHSRQSQARERRRFVEQRIVEAETELRNTESDLRTFYERNRSWQQAPQLAFEEGRLRRQVDIRQEVYVTLKREFETARIEEVNDTPVITVIDSASPPQLRTKPRRTVMVLLAFVAGVFLSVFTAVSIPYLVVLRRGVVASPAA